MPSEDMGSIPGLQENYQHALEDNLGIISIRALAEADDGVLHTALRRTRPPPSRERIANWQNAARRKLSETVTEKPDWHDVARFAVNLTRRRVNGKWEPWLTVEQAERGPEAPHREWPSWDSTPLGPWMRSQLDRPEDQAEPGAGAVGSISTAGEPEAATAAPSQAGAKLRIDSATVTDAVHELRLMRDGNLIGGPGEDLIPPVRLELTVSGARSGRQVWAAVWFLRRARPGWSPEEPVIVPSSGQAGFDLSSVLPGEYEVRLLTWASNPATMAGVTLPKLSFRPAEPEDDPADARTA
jgi:hypothetical protein